MGRHVFRTQSASLTALVGHDERVKEAHRESVFTMAHELKHHLVDSKVGTVLCRSDEETRRIEIGAEVFAAELIYPEKDFVYDLFRILRGIPQAVSPEVLVELKQKTDTTLSYAALAKRSVLLKLATDATFRDVRWGDLKRRVGTTRKRN